MRKHIGPLPLLAALIVFAAGHQAGARLHTDNADVDPRYRFERVGPFGGEVRSLLWSHHRPKTVWLGTSDGQLFISGNSGRSWDHVFPGIGRRGYVIDTIVAHPSDPNRIYIGAWDRNTSGGGLFESRNGGISWQRLAIPENRASIRGFDICRDHPERMIAGTLGGLYTSRDEGRSWKLAGQDAAGEPINIESVAIDPENPERVYVGTWRLGFRSADFGETWQRNEKGMISDSDVFSIVVRPDAPSVIYSSACTGVYRSNDRAATWKHLRPLQNRTILRTQIVLIDHIQPRRIFAGTTEGLHVSDDEGSSWSRISPASWTINALQVNPRQGNELLVGTGVEGVMRSDDGGRTWKASNQGFSSHQVTRVFPDPGGPGRYFVMVTSAGDQSGFFLFQSMGNEWKRIGISVAEGSSIRTLITLPGRENQLAATRRGIVQWNAATGKWTKLAGSLGNLSISDFAFDPEGPFLFAGTRQGIYRARPDSLTFGIPGPPFMPDVYSLTKGTGTGTALYAACSLGVARSLDQGVTWRVISAGLPLFSRVHTVAVSPAVRGHLYAGTSGGLFESANDGASWKAVFEPALQGDVHTVCFLDDSGRLVAAAGSKGAGIFFSADAGGHWSLLSSPAFDSPVMGIAHDSAGSGTLLLGTQNDGVYRLILADPVSSLSRPGGR